MVSIVSILTKSGGTREVLVLFDELGAGTDPVEGAALAVSILERVRESGALCAATTHYAELKEFALDTDGVCNAGCEFDLESLRPTYRLIIGAPGKSNAFAISRKLGLDEEIVRRAESYVSGESRRFESVIASLEESRADMERERAEAQRLREELESYKKTEEERLRVEYGRVERELERQRAIALGMVESAKSAGDYIMAELEEVKRHKDAADLGERMSAAKQNIRRRLRQVDNKINPVSEKVADEDYVLPRKLRAGDEVTVMSLGKSGEVVSVPDKGDSVTVKVGIITTRVPIKDLRLAEDNSSGFLITEDKKKKAIKPGTKELRTAAFSPEIDIRGETGEDGWFIVDRYLDNVKDGRSQDGHGRSRQGNGSAEKGAVAVPAQRPQGKVLPCRRIRRGRRRRYGHRTEISAVPHRILILSPMSDARSNRDAQRYNASYRSIHRRTVVCDV